MSEKFFGYAMDAAGTYGEPKVLEGVTQVGDFLLEHVEKFHELRITDGDDALVMHVVNQTLLHPLTNGMVSNNKWDPEKKKFVAQV